MNLRQVWCALVLTGFALGVVPAGAENVLSWEDCLRTAERENPSLLAAAAAVTQAQAALDIRQSSYFPQLSLSAGAGMSGAGDTDLAARYNAGASVRQLLYDGWETPSAAAAARADLTAARELFASTYNDVWLTARTAFVDLTQSMQLEQVTRSIAERRHANVDLVKLRYDAGRENEGSVLSAEADAAQADYDVGQAVRDVNLARRRLASAMGMDPLNSPAILAEFQELGTDREKPALTELAEGTPELRRLAAREEAARRRLDAAYAAFYPQLDATASAGWSDDHWPLEERNWSAGVELSWPLFTGGSRLGQAKQQAEALRQAEAERKAGRHDILYGLEAAWSSLAAAREDVVVSAKYLEAAEARARIASAQYTTGLVSYNDWSVIEDRLVSAQKAQLAARTNVLKAEAQWMQHKGVYPNHE